MKKSVVILLVAVAVAGCASLLGLYSAFDMNSKAKVSKETSITDSSATVSREYKVGNFEKIEVEGNIRVEFVQGTSKGRMTVTAPSYEMEHLKVEVKGTSLEIGYDKSYFTQSNGRDKKRGPQTVVKVASPSLRSIEMSLSAKFEATSLKQAGKIDIDVDTSGSVDIKTVDCGELSLSADTSGTIRLGVVNATEVKAEPDTSGTIRIEKAQTANAVLKADTSGRVIVSKLTTAYIRTSADTSGSVEVESLAADNVVGRADTSGRISLKGEATNVDFHADTSGSIKAGELKAETAKVGFDTGGKVVYCARKTSHDGSSLVNTYKE
ncbi:MAG: DUF2807 domain-containing protein [Muribaculaceae bacterium]|nr:DUF2807 domain-containing protein [Muribaculaceae bacterium]